MHILELYVTNFVTHTRATSNAMPSYAVLRHFRWRIHHRFLFNLNNCRRCFLLHVRYIEEICEQAKIAKIHQRAILYVLKRLLAVATTLRFHPICRHVDHEAHYHLRYLDTCDELVYPTCNIKPHRTRRIVCVHKRMNSVVHHHEPAAGTSVVCVAVPHVNHDADVMVPVQEDQRLFAQHDENRVAEFVHLRYNKHVRPERCRPVKVGRAAQTWQQPNLSTALKWIKQTNKEHTLKIFTIPRTLTDKHTVGNER